MVSRNRSASILVWLAWAPAVLFVLYQFLLQTSTSVMVPQLMCDLQVSLPQVGILSAAFFYPYVILQIPAGLLVDRIGPRRTLMISLLICMIAAGLFSLSHSNTLALLSRMLMGIASAPAVVCAMCLAAKWFPARQFGLLAGIVESLGMVGGALGQYLLSHVVEWLSWRWAMGLSAVVAIFLLLAVILLVRDHSGQGESINHGDLEQQVLSIWSSLKLAIKLPQLWLSCIYIGLMFAIVSAFAALWAVPFIMNQYHTSSTLAATGGAIIFIGVAIGAALAGALADRLGRCKPVMLMFALIATVLMTVVLYVPMGLAWKVLVLFALGIAVGAYVLPFAIVKKLTPPHIHGVSLALTNMIGILLGAPLLQPLIGWMMGSEKLHYCSILPVTNYQFALSPLVVVLALAVFVACFIREST